jgi:hypothetical protein
MNKVIPLLGYMGKWSSSWFLKAFSWNNKTNTYITWTICEWIKPYFLIDKIFMITTNIIINVLKI